MSGRDTWFVGQSMKSRTGSVVPEHGSPSIPITMVYVLVRRLRRTPFANHKEMKNGKKRYNELYSEYVGNFSININK